MTTVVVGACGLVGRAVCRVLASSPEASAVALVRRPPSEDLGIPWTVAEVGRSQSDLKVLASADIVIWVAGGADHGLGDRDPVANLAANTLPLLALFEVFHGRLVMLSSQAVYSGLSGSAVDEDVDHVPNMAYGLSKLIAERHAMWARERDELAGLWIHRLMYTFGTGEAPRRLLPRLVRAANDGQEATVAGGGRSFLNPLPVSFLAQVLVRSASDLEHSPSTGSVVTNICHPRSMTVHDVVELVRRRTGVSVRFHDGCEPWPVRFQGSPARLGSHLSRWGLEFPDPESEISRYVDEMRKEEVR